MTMSCDSEFSTVGLYLFGHGIEQRKLEVGVFAGAELQAAFAECFGWKPEWFAARNRARQAETRFSEA